MKELMNFLPGDNLRRNRLLLVGAVIFLFLTLAYCHLQSPTIETDAEQTISSGTESSTQDSTADQDPDNDGVTGERDACPDQAGAALDNGCPVDTDGDGVADLDDPCPAQAGNDGGCPADGDKDGVADTEDACPDNAGTANNQGCPTDSDGDGVADAIDQCPQTSGLVALDGCAAGLDTGEADAIPDSDAANLQQDAVTTATATTKDASGVDTNSTGDDSNDDSNKAGAAAGETASGNPDTADTAEGRQSADADGDGITGEFDRCPDQFGEKEYGGCPPDSDGDGVPDINDNCPKVAGPAADNGCPAGDSGRPKTILGADDQQILDDAIARVAFDSNSATLTSDSRKLLTAVAGLMQKYPAAILEIRGHTDASGVADKNMQLSMARARSAAAFIVSVGIDVNRIRAFGFGESQPVADNNSVEGRRLNRRVEFELLFDK
jgi:outer membrane protein OmpA-like peptidoglycan-associated protein